MRLSSLVLLALLLTGCGTLQESVTGMVFDLLEGKDNEEAPAALTVIEPEVKIKQLWHHSVGVGYDGRLVKLVPAVADGKVVAADREGLVQAFDAKSGDRLWKVKTKLPISGGPGRGSKAVLLGTSDAKVVALGLDDGSTLWSAKVSSEVLAIPRSGRGIVIVRTVDGRMTALNELGGEVLWTFERTMPALSLRGTAAPAIMDDLVIGGYDSGKLVALQLQDGKQLWETSIAMPRGRTELERLVDLDADPVVADGVAYVAGFQSGVSAVSLRDGEVLWRREELSSFAGFSADRRYLYLTDEQSNLWELDQRNGAALWKQTELRRRKLTAPVPYDRYIVVGDLEGYVHWLSQDDARQLGRVRVTKAAIEAAPVVVDGIVYVYASDGTLAALTLE